MTERHTHMCGICGWMNPECPHSRDERTAWLLADIDRRNPYHPLGGPDLWLTFIVLVVIFVAVAR